MKKRVLCLIIVGILIVAFIVLSEIRNSDFLFIADNNMKAGESIYGAFPDMDASLGSEELVYIKKNRIYYYDLNTGTSHVLCSRPNCLHNSNKCVAYFIPDILGGDDVVTEAAHIGNYIYCFARQGAKNMSDRSKTKLDLVRIDYINNNRKTIASFDHYLSASHNDDIDKYYVSSVGDVLYCNGYCFCRLNMRQRDTYEQIGKAYIQACFIDLNNGEIVYIGDEEHSYVFETIGSDIVLLSEHIDTSNPLISYDDFYAQYHDGEACISDIYFKDYDSYIDWYYSNCEYTNKYYLYNVKDRSIKCIRESDSLRVYRYSNSYYTTQDVYSQYPSFFIRGWYDDCLIVAKLIQENGVYSDFRYRLILWDLKNNIEHEIYEINQGDLLTVAQGHRVNHVLSDGLLFFADNIDYKNDTADIYAYDVNKGEVSFLFTDRSAISFRVFCAYGGGYIGKMYEEQELCFYWISQDDYFSGNLESAIKLGL